MPYLCGVCERWRYPRRPHNCTEPHAGPPVLVLEPHETKEKAA